MADAATAPAANRWTALISYAPVALALVAALSAGGVGATIYHRSAPTEVAKSGLPTADKPTPIACAQDFHDVNSRIDGLTAKIDEALTRKGGKR